MSTPEIGNGEVTLASSIVPSKIGTVKVCDEAPAGIVKPPLDTVVSIFTLELLISEEKLTLISLAETSDSKILKEIYSSELNSDFVWAMSLIVNEGPPLSVTTKNSTAVSVNAKTGLLIKER